MMVHRPIQKVCLNVIHVVWLTRRAVSNDMEANVEMVWGYMVPKNGGI